MCKGKKVRKPTFLFLLEIEVKKKTTRSIENNAHVYVLLDSFTTLPLIKSGV